MNHPSSSAPDAASLRRWRLAAGGLIAVALTLVATTFDHYGMSWDQPNMYVYGQDVLRYYATAGADRSAITHVNHPYGGLFEVASTAVQLTTGLNWFFARTLASGLFGVLGLIAVMRCGWITYGPRVGVTAGALLLLTPVYYGHQFINPKDIPFAVLTMWALRYLVELVQQFPCFRWRTVVLAGIAMGSAMAVRVGGVQLFGVLAIGITAAVGLARPHENPLRAENWRRWSGQVLTMAGLAWAIMLLFWPFGLSAPISGPFEALREFSHYWWPGFVFYNGELLKSAALPWTYLPNLFARQLPEVILAGLLAGPIAIVMALQNARVVMPRTLLAPTIVLASGVLLPIALIWALRANLYDGVRHVLFIVPPIALLSAVGTWSLVDQLPRRAAQSFGALMLILAAGVGIELFVLHPYEYVYFNRAIAGGLPAASKRYDNDYWAIAQRESAEWVALNYDAAPGVTILYDSGGAPEQVDFFLPRMTKSGAEFRRAAAGETARLHFLIRRYHQHQELKAGKHIYSVTREGVPLADVVETGP